MAYATQRFLAIFGVMTGVCSSLFALSPQASDMLSIRPANITLVTKDTQQFTAFVEGSHAISVRWMVAGIPGGNAKVGTISAGGLYTAPVVVPAGPVELTALAVGNSQIMARASVLLEEDPAVEEAHRQWLAGVSAAAARYGCRPELVQQQPNESVTDALKLFVQTAQKGSCLVLAPISSELGSPRYSFASGGKVDGVEIRYLSDVSRIRVWEGAEVNED